MNNRLTDSNARTAADALQVTKEGEGIPLSVAHSAFVVGLSAWSGGTMDVLDQVVLPGVVIPPHRHAREAQASYVISGRIGFWVDGEEVDAGPGTYVHRPAGKLHSLWNATSEPARMLELTYPAEDFERYMQAVTELIDSGEADPDSLAELGSRYGVEFDLAPLADICERHGVSPGGGFWK